MTCVGVLTVDDQPIFRQAARTLIESTPGFAVIGEAESGEGAITAVAQLHPDLVLLDVRMPGLDGIETARRLTAEPGGPVVVLVSGYEADEVAALVEECGAAALVPKERLRPRLLRELWARHGSGAGVVRG